MVMRADYKALAEDSQWQQTCAAADINMAAMRGRCIVSPFFNDGRPRWLPCMSMSRLNRRCCVTEFICILADPVGSADQSVVMRKRAR